ncbi:MAG: sensor histidine kinase, partial [Actinomycetota bacterium]|nr:sensor histidine kinase [Actinomycetota bacterium]
ERPAATLPLPGWLAPACAIAVVATFTAYPFALGAGGLSLVEAVNGFHLHSTGLCAVLGAVILAKRPGHMIGWILVASGLLDTIPRLIDVYFWFTVGDLWTDIKGGVVATTPTVNELPVPVTIVAMLGWTWVPAIAAVFIALPLCFPDGRLLSTRWRGVVLFGAAATALLSASVALYDVIENSDEFVLVASVLFGLAMLVSLAPLALRFRRSRGTERQQLKWVYFGLAISIPLVVSGMIAYNFGGGGYFSIAPFVILPVTITVAVLRYRLYDIDLVINKSLVFVVLAGFITAVYAAVVVGLGRLLPVGEGNLGLAIAATALVAVAFEPVRVRVQHWANRLVYGRRASPYEALAAMTARIGESADPDAVLAEAARLLADGTGAGQAVVWVAQGERLVPRAVAGTSGVEPSPVGLPGSGTAAGSQAGAGLPVLPGADLAVPVRHEGQLVGLLSLAKRPGEGVSTADRRLVEELAGQAALLLANTRLRSRLTDRLVELRASRQRMLAAQDRARHALERDLHDGAQQELVALKIKLGLACTVATREGAPGLAADLAGTAVVADQAVDTLRDVARGIYPPLLESEGLGAALSAQARRADLAVTVLDKTRSRYPREIEATAYFCAVEAVQNAVRHANASNAHIELDATDTALTITVTDDGAGFDPDTTPSGSGLTHMTDRADSAAGTLTINSRPGHGTTITLELPVPAEATAHRSLDAPAQASARANGSNSDFVMKSKAPASNA